MTDEELKRLLRESLGGGADEESHRDLWPEVRARIVREASLSAAAVPWLDWALMAGIAGAMLLFPAAVPVFLYYM